MKKSDNFADKHRFLLSIVVILLVVYSMFFGIIDEQRIVYSQSHVAVISIDGGFRTHIITNIVMSFGAYVFLQRSLYRAGVVRLLYVFLFVAAAYYALFINKGTTGHILTLSLISLVLVQQLKGKSIIAIPLFIAAMFIYGYGDPESTFHHAVNKINGGISYDGGSASQRREFFENSVYLIVEQPWVGGGTGSVEARYSQVPQERVRTWLTSNPHNEYAATGLQLGVLGLFGLLFLFYVQAGSTALIQSSEYRYISQGLVLLIIVSSFGNSMLMDSGEGHFWSYFSALLFSAVDNQKNRA